MTTEDRIPALAADGHQLDVFVCAPENPAGGIVLLQEIFGVNDQMRSFARRYSAMGYHVVVPSLFDRIEPGVELGYSSDDLGKAIALKGKSSWEEAFLDIAAARALIPVALRVAIIGYCWGGTLAFRVANRIGADAVVAYYGGQIAQFLDERPVAPLLMHFGDADGSIPLSDVEHIKAAVPGAKCHMYQGGHGFACDARGSFVADSAQVADARTEVFLRQHVG